MAGQLPTLGPATCPFSGCCQPLVPTFDLGVSSPGINRRAQNLVNTKVNRTSRLEQQLSGQTLDPFRLGGRLTNSVVQIHGRYSYA